MSKVYLGDAVYANFANGMITLTTEDGIRTTNTIHLEPEVYDALQDYVGQLRNSTPFAVIASSPPKSSTPNVGDVVEVFWNGNWVLRAVQQVGTNPPMSGCLMVQGLLNWFTTGEYRVPDINNFLERSFEEDQECPNCHSGTLEKVGNDVYTCRGECGAFFRGPCQHPNRNFNGGCGACGDPSL